MAKQQCVALGAAALVACACMPAAAYECSFKNGGWDSSEWLLVKSPRWEHFGGWTQKDDCIQNQTPPGASDDEMLGKAAPETYTSMVLKKRLSGDVAISSTMDFTYQMAPLIVVASDLGADKAGRPEYREHYEVVLFDKGLNVWKHMFVDGKPKYEKAAFLDAAFKPNTKYVLKVEIKETAAGRMMVASVGDKKVELVDNSIPRNYYVGVTGCEGVNHFYDFSAVATAK